MTFKYPDYGVLNLILKISGIEAMNFSTKSFISCSEIVKATPYNAANKFSQIKLNA